MKLGVSEMINVVKYSKDERIGFTYFISLFDWKFLNLLTKLKKCIKLSIQDCQEVFYQLLRHTFT